MAWTEAKIADLKRLWTAGQSTSQIGTVLGVSKNAVIGKAHRLKLPARPSPIRHSPGPKKPKRAPQEAETSATAEASSQAPTPASLHAHEVTKWGSRVPLADWRSGRD
jgi:GcrA cell cycle regulator